MPTHYVMKEMPDLQGKGERVTYPQMVLLGQSSTRELAEYISLRSGFSPGMVEGIICELAEAMAHTMARGFSAKIDGIGTFTPGLVIGADKGVKKRTVTPPIAMRRASLWGKLIFRRKRNWCIKPIGTVRCGVHRGSLSALRKNILPDNGWR